METLLPLNTMHKGQKEFEDAHRLMAQSDGGAKLADAADAMRRAADLGHAGAANNYGALLQYGRGTREDLPKARAYYQQAAEAGLPEGLFNLGFMWLHGHGGPQDVVEARSLFERAAAGDDTDALTHLGRMAMIGEGGVKDPGAALAYWRKGAELQDSRCAFNLGVATVGGHAGDADFYAGYAWFLLAKALGNQSAQMQLTKLELVMSEAEIKAAQRIEL